MALIAQMSLRNNKRTYNLSLLWLLQTHLHLRSCNNGPEAIFHADGVRKHSAKVKYGVWYTGNGRGAVKIMMTRA